LTTVLPICYYSKYLWYYIEVIVPEARTPSILSPSMFVSEALCELTFEDALDKGLKRSMELEDREFHPTSIRFYVRGLANWIKAYSKSVGKRPFAVTRDACWMIKSFCENDRGLTTVVQEYYLTLKEITETTIYVDLAKRLDDKETIRNLGSGGSPVNVLVAREAHGVILDCADALGVSFSILYQVVLAWCLSRNSRGNYINWYEAVVSSAMDEILGLANQRIAMFREVRHLIEYRKIPSVE
jgi:hypothetical protein